ncbi:hypothetical protein P879_03667 [Paragonimus westermani]|uniref:Death domain-containing protein n=1 Tax=Paragonimus westermani TaxID=34504 RepID=A0A8T0D126_9TREM|nr:hypothetical protein P879_03667 [Paragonimus westermani]
MTTQVDSGPKTHDQDCELVTTAAPLYLSSVELQLFEWARRDRADAIKKLVEERKCNLNVQDNYNRTPLHFAASNGNLATVRFLVESRALIDVVDKYGITPLMWAVYNNHRKVAIFLIENGAKHTKITKQGHTIIHFIAESNAVGILKYLYQKYHILKIDQEDNSGLTPFLVAAHRGNQLLLEVFVKQKCLVSKKDKRQRTALHLASWKGHMAVVSYLLNIPDIVTMINHLDSEGKSALHLAAESNHQEVVRMLLNAGSDPNISSESHDSPLIELSRSGYHSCIDMLLAHGADKDTRTKNGNSAIHVATLANLPDTVYFLVSRNFDLHAINDRKQTALHLATEQNKLEATEALLLAGARLDLKDGDGVTPLEVAARASYTTLVDMIIKADRWRELSPAVAEAARQNVLRLQERPTISGTPMASGSQQNVGRYSPLAQYDRLGSSVYHSSDWIGSANLPGAYENRRQESNNSSLRFSNSQYDPRSPTETTSTVKEQTPIPGRVGPPEIAMDTDEASMFSDPYAGSFIDPYEMFPQPVLPVQTEPAYSPSNSRSYSDDLSLGFEASRVWLADERRQRNNSTDLRQSTSDYATRENMQQRSTLFGQNADERTLITRSENAANPQYSVLQERRLPNGEIVVSVGEPNSGTRRTTDGEQRPQYMSEVQDEYRLVTFNQPHVEEMKVLLFEVAHKHLKPEDWKSLGQHWGFKPEHIAAIEYQEKSTSLLILLVSVNGLLIIFCDARKSSYKEHGYRLMSIWLHGVEPDKSPVNELYLALIAIGRKKLAKKFRESVEQTRSHKGCRVH